MNGNDICPDINNRFSEDDLDDAAWQGPKYSCVTSETARIAAVNTGPQPDTPDTVLSPMVTHIPLSGGHSVAETVNTSVTVSKTDPPASGRATVSDDVTVRSQ